MDADAKDARFDLIWVFEKWDLRTADWGLRTEDWGLRTERAIEQVEMVRGCGNEDADDDDDDDDEDETCWYLSPTIQLCRYDDWFFLGTFILTIWRVLFVLLLPSHSSWFIHLRGLYFDSSFYKQIQKTCWAWATAFYSLLALVCWFRFWIWILHYPLIELAFPPCSQYHQSLQSLNSPFSPHLFYFASTLPSLICFLCLIFFDRFSAFLFSFHTSFPSYLVYSTWATRDNLGWFSKKFSPSSSKSPFTMAYAEYRATNRVKSP